MNKRSELLAIIEASKPDIIAITETLPKQRGERIQVAELEIPDFDCFKNGANGRGVCIYTKKYLKAIQVEDLTSSNFEECMWCEIRLDGNDKLLIGCVYRSPSSTNANNSQLQELILNSYRRNPSHLLIVGDFNYLEINWVSWTSSVVSQHNSKDLIDTLQDNFLVQLVDKPTRYREGQKPSLLDLIITNEENFINGIAHH